jgi:C-terminal peptidase prc
MRKMVKRQSINISSTSDIFLMSNGVGYARLELFSYHSHQELKDSIVSLQKEGMKKLILDLRDNSGGLLDQAIKISNEFLEKGELITYTLGAKRKKQSYKANGKGSFIGLPLVILVNEGSASASEVLSAALQDNKKATIIGEQTYGKGLVQETYYLSNGGSLNITIARYYTPKGKCIQKQYSKVKSRDSLEFGIKPNLEISQKNIPFPALEDFRYVAKHYLYKKNWKLQYPRSTQFANQLILKSDSIQNNLALGIMLYGPKEIPNLLLTKDPAIEAANDLLIE